MLSSTLLLLSFKPDETNAFQLSSSWSKRSSRFRIHSPSPAVSSFSNAPKIKLSETGISKIPLLYAISQIRQAILDGAEWASVQNLLQQQVDNNSMDNSVGIMSIVTGTILEMDSSSSRCRVVGIQVPNVAASKQQNDNETVALTPDCYIYKDSMSFIPQGISDDLAMSTLVASLAPIHCALPKQTSVGGSSDSDFLLKNGKVVVVGGSDYAKFVARGIAAMGFDVFIVSTGNPQIADIRVQSLDPAVGDLQIGFCSHIGTFDTLVDTISDERGSSYPGNTFIVENGGERGGVPALLKTRHNCDTYISTMTVSQRIIRDEGVLFGPAKVKSHVNQLHKVSATAIKPPKGFGSTLQTLLDESITFSWKLESSNSLVRTWTLPEFWELTSWPRDSDGASDVRYGFPVVDDLDVRDENDREEDDGDDDGEQMDQTGSNPFVTVLSNVQDLTREVINRDKDCLLFLSAKYCRTCKSIGPAFTRLARLNQSDKLMFCRADTTGPKGKELGKVLKVNAVPLFVLFKRGERFGTPLLINKLPSQQLDLALQFLQTGSRWDATAIEKVRERDENRQRK